MIFNLWVCIVIKPNVAWTALWFSCWIACYSLHLVYTVPLNRVTQMKTEWMLGGKLFRLYWRQSYVWEPPCYFGQWQRQFWSHSMILQPFRNTALFRLNNSYSPSEPRGRASLLLLKLSGKLTWAGPITGHGRPWTRPNMIFPWEWHSDAEWKKPSWFRDRIKWEDANLELVIAIFSRMCRHPSCKIGSSRGKK